MKIVVLGTRGFPNVQGGVEKHCENIYPLLAQKGCEIIVFGRAPYIGKTLVEFQGIKIIPLSCPKNKFLEAFVHTFKGVFAARKYNPDLLHIHAVGPSLMIPLARFLGFKVVMTHHGPDYERKKWNKLAKFILKAGEYLGIKYANQVIAISGVIADNIKKKYRRDAIVIPNGVNISEIAKTEDILKKLGLEKGKYLLAVGRFVPEKGFDDLIEAFKQGQPPKSGDGPCFDWKLVIVGGADHEDKYSLSLKEKARNTSGVILTGFLSGIPLEELYSYAGLFVLSSYYEGLPIVLLEALSYGLSCLVSDIPANREVGLQENRFFKGGDVKHLAEKINEFISKSLSIEEKSRQVSFISKRYNWEIIARQTLEAYRRVSAC